MKTNPSPPTAGGYRRRFDDSLLRLAMRQFVWSAKSAVAVIDPGFRLYWFNTSFGQRYGLDGTDALGNRLSDWPQTSFANPAVAQRLQEVEQTGVRTVMETRSRSREGANLWVDLRLAQIRDEEDKPTGFLILTELDISARKLGEALDRARHVTLARLGEGADLDTILKALVETIEAVSPDMFTSILLLDETGKRFRSVAGPRLPDAYLAALNGVEIGPEAGSCGTAAYTGSLVISENIFEDPKWRDYLQFAKMSGMQACWSQPITDVSGGVVGTFAIYYRSVRRPTPDETSFIEEAANTASIAVDRTRLETALHEARLRAEGASLAKSRFLANISHELRTPLNAVIGFADLMAAGMIPHQPERYAEFASEISSSAKTLLDLISTLLESANLQQGHYHLEEDVIDLAPLIRDCLESEQEEAARRHITLQSRGLSGLSKLRVDPSAVRKVIFRVVDNAMKYSPDGGIIDVSGETESDGAVVITVSDTGQGILEADVSRVLEPFEQGGEASAYLARQYGGTGLGLAICHSLMKLHGGEVVLDSALGQGTHVKLRFPASRVVRQ